MRIIGIDTRGIWWNSKDDNTHLIRFRKTTGEWMIIGMMLFTAFLWLWVMYGCVKGWY